MRGSANGREPSGVLVQLEELNPVLLERPQPEQQALEALHPRRPAPSTTGHRARRAAPRHDRSVEIAHHLARPVRARRRHTSPVLKEPPWIPHQGDMTAMKSYTRPSR
ncbi:hypothetical protein PtB15_9B555 [Puccinia triticina]|nr:hypothetical protein PtB15_9B555 [Puccinia triticina]